ncbi:MAG TPA: hypothetical protein VF627_11730 [Abditibacterium sp.]|jgi:iron(III) transport system substrate-binding protein
MALNDNEEQQNEGGQQEDPESQNEKKLRFLRAALYFAFGAFMVLWIVAFLQGCAPRTSTAKNNRVVLYCSVDEVYAKPLIQKLELQTGLQIDALFDTEATKTAGLANRIRAERARPRADVFWSSALLQTLLMSEEKLLQPYSSSATKDLPPQFVGKDWAGVGARAHIFTVSQPRFSNFNSLWGYEDLSPGSGAGFSNLQFGTSSDWVTALTLRQGQQQILRRFKNMKAQENRVLPGNGDVARQVGDGTLLIGITDSDDFLAQQREGKKIFLADPGKETVLIPGAASILKNSPNPEGAKRLFDAIASAQNEANLVKQMPGVFSLRHLNEKSNFQSGGVDFSFLMNAPRDDYSKWPATWRKIREPLNQIFASK